MSILLAFCVLLVALVIYWAVRPKGVNAVQHREIEPMHEPHAPFGTFVDSAHGWVRMMSDGTMRIGLDAFVAEALNRLDAIELPECGQKLERGQIMALLQVGEVQLPLPAPIAGEVVGRNSIALQNPHTPAADPYGLGWLLSMRAKDHKEALAPLHVGNGAAGFLREEFARLSDFLANVSNRSALPLMTDGGVPQRGAVSELGREGLWGFARRFLSQS